MYDYIPKLLWWFAVPIKELRRGYRGARRLVQVPFGTWEDFVEYVGPNGNDVLLFTEDDEGSGLVKTKASITRFGGQFFASVEGNQFYEISDSTMVNKWQIERTDDVAPEDILYVIRLNGADESESESIVVTRDHKFYHLAARSVI